MSTLKLEMNRDVNGDTTVSPSNLINIGNLSVACLLSGKRIDVYI